MTSAVIAAGDRRELPVDRPVDRSPAPYHVSRTLSAGAPMPPSSQPTKQPRFKKETTYHAWYWLAVLIAGLVIQMGFASFTQIAQIPYSQFQDDLKAGKIAEVRVSGNYFQGHLKTPDAQGRTDFITTRVDPEIAGELAKYDVKFAGAIESTFLRDLLSWIVPIGLFFGIWVIAHAGR